MRGGHGEDHVVIARASHEVHDFGEFAHPSGRYGVVVSEGAERPQIQVGGSIEKALGRIAWRTDERD